MSIGGGKGVDCDVEHGCQTDWSEYFTGVFIHRENGAREWSKTKEREISSEQQFPGQKNDLLKPEVRGVWPDWFQMTQRSAFHI